MAVKYLGQPFDIHGGGLENVFPHNECEIAQSEADTNLPFARYWLLAGSLTIDGVKMSKSLGNSVTIRQALERWRPEVVRTFILSTHYRSPVDFTEAAVDAAGKGWERINSAANLVRQQLRNAPDGPLDQGFAAFFEEHRAAFRDKMDDDFNAPAALGVLQDFTRGVNTLLNSEESPTSSTLEAIGQLYNGLAGLIELLVEIRTRARQNREWARADEIRDRLADLGVVLEDRPDGTFWRIGGST
jgi:cysteinyl-tRNA synthetase